MNLKTETLKSRNIILRIKYSHYKNKTNVLLKFLNMSQDYILKFKISFFTPNKYYFQSLVSIINTCNSKPMI